MIREERIHIMRLKKQDTKKLQGIAILCMFALHLFNRIDIEDYYNLHLYIGNIPLLTKISYSFDMCVPIYLFCSGYGMQKQDELGKCSLKYRAKRIINLLIKYWFVIAITCAIGYFVGMKSQFPGTILTFLENALLLKNSYVGALWFVQTYVILLLLWNVFQYVIKHFHWGWVSIGSLFLYVISWSILYFIQPHIKNVICGGVVNVIVLALRSQFPFVIGIILAKEDFVDTWNLGTKIRKNEWASWIGLCVVVIVRMFFPNMFFAPFTAFVVIFLFGTYKWDIVNKILHYFGKHSTNMWMTHMQFYAIFCPKLVFQSRNVFLIFGTLIVLTLITSYIMMSIEKIVGCFWIRKGAR